MGAHQSKTKTVKVTLTARKSGTPGFKRDLTLTGIEGEQLGTLLAQFNAFRSPTNQITQLIDVNTQIPLDLSQPLIMPIHAFVN